MDTVGGALAPGSLAVALVAGAVATFNPCGFALLPAYLALLVAGGDAGDAPSRRGAAVARALRFTAGMSAGFVAVFGAFALVVVPLALSVERWLPVLTLAMGLVLVGLGGWLLAGRSLPAPSLGHRGRAPGASWTSQAAYGVTFALASLSCTVAPFLAVTTSALRGGSPVGIVAVFLAYALGMGAAVGVLALAAATASATVTARLRRVAPLVSRLSGALLLVAGAYVAWYGWFELRVLAGTAVDDPVVSAAIQVQSASVRALVALGVPGVIVAASLVAVVACAGLVAARRRRPGAELDEQLGVERC